MSPMIQPDLTDSVGPEPGTYPTVIKGAAPKMSQNQNPMVELDLEVNIGNGKSRKQRDWIVVSGEGAFKFGQLLRACHFDDLANAYSNPGATKPPFDTDQLVGQEVNIILDRKLDNQGQMRTNVTAYLRK